MSYCTNKETIKIYLEKSYWSCDHTHKLKNELKYRNGSIMLTRYNAIALQRNQHSISLAVFNDIKKILINKQKPLDFEMF